MEFLTARKYHSEAMSEDRLAADLAEVASAAALLVAPYLRRVARSAPDVALKVDIHDPVTAHDQYVESVLRAFLDQTVPGSLVLGEEMGEGGGDYKVPTDVAPDGLALPAPTAALDPTVGERVADLGPRVRWIVDPIDGTANFASGLTYFGTSIGVELDGQIVAGVVSVPFNRELFAADSKHAWHLDEMTMERTPLRSAGPTAESEALIAAYYPGIWSLNHDRLRTADHERTLMSHYSVVRRPGAVAVDLAMVAAGWIGVTMGFTFKPWDVAAGIHLVKVAGGKVMNLPMDTDLPNGLRPAIVASVGTLDAKTARSVLEEVAESQS